jgi:hypothetical protein
MNSGTLIFFELVRSATGGDNHLVVDGGKLSIFPEWLIDWQGFEVATASRHPGNLGPALGGIRK